MTVSAYCRPSDKDRGKEENRTARRSELQETGHGSSEGLVRSEESLR
jgi:hypothetical protein